MLAISLWYCHRYENIYYTRPILLHILVSSWQIYYYTRHYYSMYLYHWIRIYYHTGLSFHVLISPYTDIITLDTIISCSCITDTRAHYYIGYCCMVILYTVISCSYNTSHRFTCMHALIVSVFLLHGSLLLLHVYSCISITWLFPVTDIDVILLLLDMSVVDVWCVELSARGFKPRGLHLESHISCFSFSFILFHDINKAHVLLSYYMYHTLYCSWYTV